MERKIEGYIYCEHCNARTFLTNSHKRFCSESCRIEYVKKSKKDSFNTDTLSGEFWVAISGYEQKYAVSNLGRVKRLGRTLVNSIGSSVEVQEKLLSQHERSGYLRVRLHGKVNRNVSVHRIVAESFVCNALNKPEVNHINGIKSDNRACNLEWVTPVENSEHAFKNGLKKKVIGENNHFSRHSEDIVRKILNSKKSVSVLSEELSMPKSTVYSIKHRITWKHLV